jgi:hypothetical protein
MVSIAPHRAHRARLPDMSSGKRSGVRQPWHVNSTVMGE